MANKIYDMRLNFRSWPFDCWSIRCDG